MDNVTSWERLKLEDAIRKMDNDLDGERDDSQRDLLSERGRQMQK